MDYLYEIEEKGKIAFMISSFGIIEDAIYLTIIIKDEKLDFDNFNLSSELIELIDITEMN